MPSTRAFSFSLSLSFNPRLSLLSALQEGHYFYLVILQLMTTMIKQITQGIFNSPPQIFPHHSALTVGFHPRLCRCLAHLSDEAGSTRSVTHTLAAVGWWLFSPAGRWHLGGGLLWPINSSWAAEGGNQLPASCQRVSQV